MIALNSDGTYRARGSGTAYLTASWNGYTSSCRIDLVDSEDTVYLGLVSTITHPGEETPVVLNQNTRSELGEGAIVTWTVDNPSVVQLEISADGFGVTARSLNVGAAVITCTAVLPDGTSLYNYTNIIVI